MTELPSDKKLLAYLVERGRRGAMPSYIWNMSRKDQKWILSHILKAFKPHLRKQLEHNPRLLEDMGLRID